MSDGCEFCIVCGEEATFITLGGLCDEHWVDWWYEGYEDDFPLKTIDKWKKEDLKSIRKKEFTKEELKVVEKNKGVYSSQ